MVDGDKWWYATAVEDGEGFLITEAESDYLVENRRGKKVRGPKRYFTKDNLEAHYRGNGRFVIIRDGKSIEATSNDLDLPIY